MWELLGTIGVFTAALFFVQGLKQYISENTLFPRVDVRNAIIGKIAGKSMMTSYPNTLDEKFIKLREKAHFACEGNSQAPEHIWETLTTLLKNIGGLVVYLGILSRINGLLLLVIMATVSQVFLFHDTPITGGIPAGMRKGNTFRRNRIFVQSQNL